MSKKLFSLISKVLETPEEELSDESTPESIENWDSYNGLLLVDELESEFNIKFSVEEVFDVHSILDIKKHLQNHGVNLDE
jgi:acyl carrier protein